MAEPVEGGPPGGQRVVSGVNVGLARPMGRRSYSSSSNIFECACTGPAHHTTLGVADCDPYSQQEVSQFYQGSAAGTVQRQQSRSDCKAPSVTRGRVAAGIATMEQVELSQNGRSLVGAT